MFFALLAAGISLVYPMIVRYITNNVITGTNITESVPTIIKLIFLMVGLLILEYISNFFISYKGHIMGAKMEYDCEMIYLSIIRSCLLISLIIKKLDS